VVCLLAGSSNHCIATMARYSPLYEEHRKRVHLAVVGVVQWVEGPDDPISYLIIGVTWPSVNKVCICSGYRNAYRCAVLCGAPER